MSIYNCTPHDITVIDKTTKEVIQTFPKNEKQVRGSHTLGEQHENCNGIPVFGVGTYNANEKEWDELGLKAGDTILVSTIGAAQVEKLACRDGVRVLIPASGPGQSHRNERGEITGVYFFLEREKY